MQEITLLKFTQPLEDLSPLVGFELGQFGKDFGFAHGDNLLPALSAGKHRLASGMSPAFPPANQGLISSVVASRHVVGLSSPPLSLSPP